MYEQYYHSKENFFFVGHLSTDLRRDYYKLSPFYKILHYIKTTPVKMASLSFDEIKRRMDTIKEDIERLKQQRLSPNISQFSTFLTILYRIFNFH